MLTWPLIAAIVFCISSGDERHFQHPKPLHKQRYDFYNLRYSFINMNLYLSIYVHKTKGKGNNPTFKWIMLYWHMKCIIQLNIMFIAKFIFILGYNLLDDHNHVSKAVIINVRIPIQCQDFSGAINKKGLLGYLIVFILLLLFYLTYFTHVSSHRNVQIL